MENGMLLTRLGFDDIVAPTGADGPAAGKHLELISISVAGGTEKVIGSLGPEYLPITSLTPALRLSLTPDGKSISYSTARSTSNLWLMEGLDAVTPPK